MSTGEIYSYDCLKTTKDDFYKNVLAGKEIPVVNLGDTRHIAMMNLIISGGSPRMCMELAGHANIGISSHYYTNMAELVENQIGAPMNTIELMDGTVVRADEVITAVDTGFLYGHLIDRKYMPKELKKAYEDSRAYPVTSGFQTAYAIDSDFSGEDTIFFECDPIKIGDRTFTRMSVKSYAYDKSFAPEGRTVLQANVVQTDADYLYWESLSKEEYKAKKEELAAEMTERIVKEFPELTGRIELLDSWTPLTYNRYCNAYHGSYMGFVTTVGNKQMRFKGVVKGVNNLFIARGLFPIECLISDTYLSKIYSSFTLISMSFKFLSIYCLIL